jgi:DNA polymerase-3 subunit beta
MELSVLCENLNRAITIVSRLVSSKSQLPILNNILLATDNGRLRLSATNLETGINYWVGAKVEKEGAITIPARILGEFITSLSSGKASLSCSENILKIVCGGVSATFNGIAAEEFPKIPVLVGEPTLEFNPPVFVEAISKVAFAAATDEGRQVLTGVRWVIGDEGFLLAATDGYRLSVKKIMAGRKTGKKENIDLLIPAKALLEIVRILGEAKEKKAKEEKRSIEMRVTPGENQVIFEIDDVGLVTRLLEGQFPNFEKIIPASSTTKTVIDTSELLKAVRVAAIFARDSANLVKLKAEKDRVTISANAPQVGENTTIIEAKTEGEESEIAFNCRYLLDLLSGASCERVSLETSGSLRPGVFRFVGDDSFLHIIMPVKVQ